MKKVIGLAGVKTSGKSTVANMIKELLNENVVESALADKLKNTCAQVFNLERIQFDAQELKEVPFDEPKILDLYSVGAILESFGIYMNSREIDSKFNVIGMELKTPRQIAQIVGTEILRHAGDEDIHCRNMEMNDNGITIVSDLRFPNEFNYFHDSNEVDFLPLYIQRDEAESHVTENSHPSETSVFKFCDKCFKLNNNNSLEDLRKQISTFLIEAGYLNSTSNRA